jgi:hypothetical protein
MFFGKRLRKPVFRAFPTWIPHHTAQWLHRYAAPRSNLFFVIWWPPVAQPLVLHQAELPLRSIHEPDDLAAAIPKQQICLLPTGKRVKQAAFKFCI